MEQVNPEYFSYLIRKLVQKRGFSLGFYYDNI